MSEVQALKDFLQSGNRKEITLSDYIQLQRKLGKWTKERSLRLLSELSKSRVILTDYRIEHARVKRIVRVA